MTRTLAQLRARGRRPPPDMPPDGRQDALETVTPDPDASGRADRQRRVSSLLAANRGAGVARDPDGMGTARSWKPWP